MATVAICTLLTDRKRHILERVARSWRGLDWGGDAPYVVACTQDASDETVAAFAAAVEPLHVLTTEVSRADLVAMVDGLDEAEAGPERTGYTNAPFLHKIACLREQVRVTACAVPSPDGDLPDYLFWLDADIEPPTDAYVRLRADLTDTDGPLAPRLVGGLYCERITGRHIAQWHDGGQNEYIPLRPNAHVASRIAGFGCILGRRATFDALGWAGYGAYRYERRRLVELEPDKHAGIMGEDVWYLRCVEAAWGLPCILNTAVCCRHLQGDGSAWVYRVGDDGVLHTHYDDAPTAAAATVTLLNAGKKTWNVEFTGTTCRPGEMVTVSPEIAELLRQAAGDEAVTVGAEPALAGAHPNGGPA